MIILVSHTCVDVPFLCNFLYFFHREVMGLFRLLRNIEDDYITSNSAVAFTINKKSTYLYQDRHGNWTVGNDLVNFIVNLPN